MTVGTALRQARERRGLLQADVGGEVYLSRKTISAIERGRRRLSRQVAPKLAHQMDNPRLYMELADELCGGVMAPVYLDGENVDLHRASVRDKTIEELSEAIEALSKARALVNARSADQLNDLERQQIRNCLQELAEAETAIGMMIAVICETYGFSAAEVYREHRRELAAKGYISRTKEKPPSKRR